MKNNQSTQQHLLSVLSKTATGPLDPKALTFELRAVLLAYASETPDNVDCAKRVGVEKIGAKTGLALSEQKLLLEDIAHRVEDNPMPENLKEAYPHISEEDWSAFTRMTTLIYLLLGHAETNTA